MRVIFTIIGLLFFTMALPQQISRSVIATDGGSFIKGNMQIYWTLGEIASHRCGNEKIILTEGFQQTNMRVDPFSATSDPSAGSATDKDFTIDIYPNPVLSALRLELQSAPNSEFEIIIQDTQGRSLLEHRKLISNTPLYLDLANLPSGIYYLLLLDHEGNYQSIHKVIRS